MKSKDSVRVNYRIHFSPVRVIDSSGNNIGVIPTKEALQRAQAEGLDLVEVSPQSRPPVCRIMDYGKYKYEQQKKENHSKQKVSQVKEMRFRPNTGEHDIATKTNAIRKFLEGGHRVQIRVKFQNRENAHRDLGFTLANGIIEQLKDVSRVHQPPTSAGRDILCLLEPLAE